ncbi:MAG: hypothetical protein NZ697_00605 [Porticoccaceae bacterium]|nr:hypothetical protein [Porticoccaceae bacterium]
MLLKFQVILFTLQVNSKALHRFALALKPQTIVASLAKGYGHCLRAAPCLAALFLSANPVFN